MSMYNFNGGVPKDMYIGKATIEKAVVGAMNNTHLGEITDVLLNVDDRMNDVQRSLQQILNNQLHPPIDKKTDSEVWNPIDGTGNNKFHPRYGRASEPLLRLGPVDYQDGISSMAVRGTTNPNPRAVSNLICQGTSVENSRNLTDMIWAWGQLIDHELDLTPSQDRNNGGETADITTPSDPNELFPGNTIPFTRSQFVNVQGIRQHPNILTSFINGSVVYGSDTTRSLALRQLNGSGKLKTSIADNGEIILPYNVDGLPNGSLPGMSASSLFLAGEVRSNENIVLQGMHVIWVREHNRLCDEILLKYPQWAGNDEQIYQHASSIVSGLIQNITFNEFLPALLGPNAIPPYAGYNPQINASISTEFSTVAYRLGHTMLSSTIQKGTNPLNTVELKDAFFLPSFTQQNGVNEVLQGITLHKMQEIDGIIIEDVRSLLFGPPSAGMMHDLVSLNIQRSRDHGIPGYNAYRQTFGLAPIADFSSMPTDAQTKIDLASLYDDVGNVDPWIGALVENHVPGASVGPLIMAVLVDQFTRLRDGDRFWFENNVALTTDEKNMIRGTLLSMVLNRNMNGINVNTNVFQL